MQLNKMQFSLHVPRILEIGLNSVKHVLSQKFLLKFLEIKMSVIEGFLSP